ncbi:MAG: FAD-binding oxidoreductase [Thermoprotei archaeon]|nr:FAD-binding oxidoreductase [Thermoprotei archaeon]
MGLESFLRDVTGSLGSDIMLADVGRYSRDWWPLAMLLEKLGSWGFKPPTVLAPRSVEEVSYVVRKAGEHGVCLIAHGGGSSVTGASAPRGECVLLTLSRMRGVLEFNVEDLTVTVEAGILLSELEEWLNSRGYTIRHVPQSFHIASVGGCIATMCSGQYSTGYGSIEDIVVNMEVVLPSGDIVWARSINTPRSSMGPDLKHLFIGSEGAYGIVTKATLRVLPVPRYKVEASFEVPSFNKGLSAVREIMARGLTPALARLSDDVESMLRFGRGRPVLLLAYEASYWEVLEAMWDKAREIVEAAGGEYIGEEPYKKWLSSRFNYEEDIKLVDSMGLWFETLDVAATWSKLPRVYESVKKALEELQEKPIVMTHASHFYTTGAALYYTILYRKDPKLYWDIVETFMRTAAETGATPSHHHGVGMLKKKWLKIDPGPSTIILNKIKEALDPKNVLNSNITN